MSHQQEQPEGVDALKDLKIERENDKTLVIEISSSFLHIKKLNKKSVHNYFGVAFKFVKKL